MKKIITIAMLLLPALFTACTDNGGGSEGATSVVLSRDRVDLQVGETVAITATVLPESLKMGVSWSVLDSTYARVNDGVITGKAEGVTYVVATSADGYQKAACLVSVNPEVRYRVTVTDEFGQPVEAIYGYPGMKTFLKAVTSDGDEGHRFTWSVEDPAVATIGEDGLLTLGAQEVADVAFVYDAQSLVKVVTEDGLGTMIPVRSSLLNGIRMNGEYQLAGLPILVEASESYPFELLYQGDAASMPIPADGINLALSNFENFSLEKKDGVYTLVTGSVEQVSTILNASTIGDPRVIPIAEFSIEKSYPIKAQFAAASSSTLSFTWTEGGGVTADIARPYTICLYKDADCTDLELSYSIPASNACWSGRQPRFVFSGLTPATTYWFKVTDTTLGEEKESAVIPATTEPFNIVMVSSEPAAAGAVILAEDFGQLCWGADEISMAAGFDVATSSVAYNADTKKSFMYREAAVFVGTTGQYAQRSLTAQTVAKKEAGVRFAKWAQGATARIYVGPGYLFLSTKGYGTHIMTPKLENIPEGMTATLKITLHAAGKQSGGEAVLAVQRGKTYNEISSGTQTNKNGLDLETNVKTITFNGGITNLEVFEVTIEGVVKGDRIAFGPTAENAKPEDNSNMMLLSDMTIQIVELQ